MQKMLPTYSDFLRAIKNKLSHRTDVTIEVVGELHYETPTQTKTYDYYKISSTPIEPADKILLIRAGIHGDETTGVLTLMKHIDAIFEYAHTRGVKLIIFPLDNPSGFEGRTRYNAEGDRGDAGNNDFVRYILADGTVVDDLGSKNECKEWRWSSDPVFSIQLPKETTMLHNELKKLPLGQIAAVLDVHGDNFIDAPYTYHYVYGDPTRYHQIVEKIRCLVPILADINVNSDYLNSPDYVPEILRNGEVVVDNEEVNSDADGCILRYDASLPDLLQRLGAAHAITVETTSAVEEDVADQVNLLWVYGLIDLLD